MYQYYAVERSDNPLQKMVRIKGVNYTPFSGFYRTAEMAQDRFNRPHGEFWKARGVELVLMREEQIVE